jgi:hypothetical protein
MPILSPKILNEIWARARNEPIGLWLRVFNTYGFVHDLHASRPADMYDFTVATPGPTPDIIYITVPGTTLENVPLPDDDEGLPP